MKVGFHNTRSLHAHIEDIKSDHDLTAMAIFVIAESRLCSKDDDITYSIPNYKLFRNDQRVTGNQNRPPHGIAVYVHDQVEGDINHRCYSTEDLEASMLTISTPLESFQLVFLYKAPSCSVARLFSMFNNFANELDKTFPIFIIGDMNLDTSDGKHANEICKLQELVSCRQLIQESTTDHNTTLDLAFTNCKNVQHSLIESTWSDHKIVFIYTEKPLILNC